MFKLVNFFSRCYQAVSEYLKFMLLNNFSSVTHHRGVIAMYSIKSFVVNVRVKGKDAIIRNARFDNDSGREGETYQRLLLTFELTLKRGKVLVVTTKVKVTEEQAQLLVDSPYIFAVFRRAMEVATYSVISTKMYSKKKIRTLVLRESRWMEKKTLTSRALSQPYDLQHVTS